MKSFKEYTDFLKRKNIQAPEWVVKWAYDRFQEMEDEELDQMYEFWLDKQSMCVHND